MQGGGGFLLMLLGLFNALFPYPAWYLSTGWRIKDAEPTEAALFVNRAVGVVAAIVGLVVMVSSCSPGGSSSEYAEAFQKRMIAGEVQDIKMGMTADSPSVLSKEEVAEAVDLMAHAKMTRFTPESAYGASGAAAIVYKDGWTEELVLFGPSGHIELHPNSGDKAYWFESDELESLFRSWLKRTG